MDRAETVSLFAVFSPRWRSLPGISFLHTLFLRAFCFSSFFLFFFCTQTEIANNTPAPDTIYSLAIYASFVNRFLVPFRPAQTRQCDINPNCPSVRIHWFELNLFVDYYSFRGWKNYIVVDFSQSVNINGRSLTVFSIYGGSSIVANHRFRLSITRNLWKSIRIRIADGYISNDRSDTRVNG